MNYEWIIFVATLVCVALFHKRVLPIAASGLAITLIYKLIIGTGDVGTILIHEAPLLLNLTGLLLGFEVLAIYMTQTKIAQIIPKYLPDDWKGPFFLLAITCFLASFLDHIAAALIGGSIALVVFNKRVHISYIAAIVAASNVGGAGSVLGNITTTMLWLGGISPFKLMHAYIGAIVSFAIFGIVAAIQQHRYHPIRKDEIGHHRIHYKPLFAVLLMLIGTIAGNVTIGWPSLGLWIGIIISQFFARTPIETLQKVYKLPFIKIEFKIPAPISSVGHVLPNTLFLLSLVTMASLMPLNALPDPTPYTTFALGWISAVFDNIPLTKLALNQGGYDWGLLSFSVGVGGSMIWFGSASGVAITTLFPEAKSVWNWVKGGWIIPIAFTIGYFFQLLVFGWNH